MTNPFEIPELRHHLANFLDKNELLVYIHVCKSWRTSFTPALYYDTSIRANYQRHKAETIKKYSSFVNSLTISDHLNTAYYLIDFGNLVKLKIARDWGIGLHRVLSTLMISRIMTKSKDSLKSFSMDFIPIGQIQEIWDAIFICNKLVDLDLQVKVTIESPNLEKFIVVFSRVTNLRLRDVKISPHEGIQQKLTSLIQSSNVICIDCDCYGGPSDELCGVMTHLISKSPNLREIRWITCKSGVQSNFSYDYGELMPLSKSDFFENLSLRGYMCDSDLVLMLRAMTNAKELRLYGQSFGQRSYAALMNEHSNTITILYISECTGVSSTMIQGMLSGCPSLVCFEAGCIQGADLVRVVQSDFQSTHGTDDQEVVILGEDWSCLKLYHLSLYFNLSGFEAGIDRSTPNGKALFRRQLELEQFHAFRQLSRLHSLRYLNVDRKRNDDGHMPLNLRLRSHGGQLDQLKTLKNLRTFHPPIATLDLSDEEKKWVQDSWGPHFR